MKLSVSFASIALFVGGALALPNDNNAPKPAAADQYLVRSLPQVSFSIPKSWAGSLKIGQGFGDDSLFFWLWEAETPQGKDDLIVWFSGGPACSSLTGLFKMHGPITFPRTAASPQRNDYSWTSAANVVYVDQPIGTGFSTGSTGNGTNNSDNTIAAVQWLENFFDTFPDMRSKNIHLMGESFAGVFLPYIAQAIQAQNATMKVKLSSLSLGNSMWGNEAAMGDAIALSYLAEHRTNYGTQIQQNMYDTLARADADCGFPAVRAQIKYPPQGIIRIPGDPSDANFKRDNMPAPPGYNPDTCDFDGNRTDTPERLAYLINHTSCFGVCDPYDAAYSYFTDSREFCAYNINEKGTTGLYYDNAFKAYLNRADVKAAIHAPSNVVYDTCNSNLSFILANKSHRLTPPAYSIIPTLLSQNVKVNIFNGMLDYVLPHTGQELVIQNMTWGGAQGFSEEPTSTVMNDVLGNTLASGRTERGLSYFTFNNAGHRVAQDAPGPALVWLVNVVLGWTTH